MALKRSLRVSSRVDEPIDKRMKSNLKWIGPWTAGPSEASEKASTQSADPTDSECDLDELIEVLQAGQEPEADQAMTSERQGPSYGGGSSSSATNWRAAAEDDY